MLLYFKHMPANKGNNNKTNSSIRTYSMLRVYCIAVMVASVTKHSEGWNVTSIYNHTGS